MESHVFKVVVDWSGQRAGSIHSDTLETSIEVSAPPQFRGEPGIWSPEHLFVASVGSCFMTTFLAVAEKSKLRFRNFSCSASGFLENGDGTWKVTRIILNPTVTVLDTSFIRKTLEILKISERNCMIAKSINSDIILLPKVEVA